MESVSSRQHVLALGWLWAVSACLSQLLANSGVWVVVASGGITVCLWGYHAVRRGLDLRRIEDWAIVGFIAWVCVGFLKYGLSIDPGRTIAAQVLDGAAWLVCLGFSVSLAGMWLALGIKSQKGRAPRPCLGLARVTVWILVPCVVALRLEQSLFSHSLKSEKGLVGGGITAVIPLGATLAGYIASRAGAKERVMCLLAVCAFLVAGLGDSSRRVLGLTLFGGIGGLASGIGVASVRKHQVRVFAAGALLVCTYYLAAAWMRAYDWTGSRNAEFREVYAAQAATGQALSTLEDYCLCIEVYPEKVDYLYGVSYVAVAATYVPRSVWPGKPIAFSKELAIRKRIGFGRYAYTRALDEDMGLHSYSGTMIGEAWANGGGVAVILVSFTYGVMVGALALWMARGRPFGWAWVLAGVVAYTVLVEHRGCATAANGLALVFVPYYALDRFIARFNNADR